MEDAFAPPRDNDRRSQQSRRSATRSGDGYYIESESPSSRHDSRDDGRGKTPTKGRMNSTTRGTKESFTPRPRETTTNIKYGKATTMKKKTMLSTQNGGVISTTQGRHAKQHTMFSLGDSNNQTHLTRGCSNPRHLYYPPPRPLQQAHKAIQAWTKCSHGKEYTTKKRKQWTNSNGKRRSLRTRTRSKNS